MLSDGLYKLLTTPDQVPAIAAILSTRATQAGPPTTTGVFLGQLPEGDPLPAIVMSEITGESLMTMDGPDALRFERWQFTAHAATARGAKALQRAIRKALEQYTGELTDGSIVDNMQCVHEFDGFQEAPFSFIAPLEMAISFKDLSS